MSELLIGVLAILVIVLIVLKVRSDKREEEYLASQQTQNKVEGPTVRKFTYLKDNNTGIIRKVDDNTPRINIENSQVTIHNIIIDRTGNQELKELALENPLEDNDEYLKLVAGEYEKLHDKYLNE